MVILSNFSVLFDQRPSVSMFYRFPNFENYSHSKDLNFDKFPSRYSEKEYNTSNLSILSINNLTIELKC